MSCIIYLKPLSDGAPASRFGPLGLQPFWYTHNWPAHSQLDDGITIPPKPIRRQQPQPVRCATCIRIRLAVLKGIRRILFGRPSGQPNTRAVNINQTINMGA